MSTIREQIVVSAVTALTTGRPADVPAPVRERIDSPEGAQLPALTVYPGPERTDRIQRERDGRISRGPIVRRYLDLHVESLGKASAGVASSTAVDPMLAWATKALAAWAGSEAFAALAHECDEMMTEPSYEQHGEVSLCRQTQVFRIEYQTLAIDAERVT